MQALCHFFAERPYSSVYFVYVNVDGKQKKSTELKKKNFRFLKIRGFSGLSHHVLVERLLWKTCLFSFISFSCKISQKFQSFYLLSFSKHLHHMIKCKKIFFNKIMFFTIHLHWSKSYLRYSVGTFLLCNIGIECNKEIFYVYFQFFASCNSFKWSSTC